MRLILTQLLLLLLSVPSWAGIISFTASPATFLPGQDVTLSWSVTPGDSISINQGTPAVSGATGSVVVHPVGTTVYTLTDSTSSTTSQVTATLYAAVALTHRWGFNEASGTVATDSVGGTSGTLINAASGTNWTRANAAGGATSPDRVRLPGGGSGVAPYIDLPNTMMAGLTKFTFEGWMTLHGAQTWSRYFDFGTNSGGEQNAPGGGFSGTEYIMISAQSGGTTTQRVIAMKDNNVEQQSVVTDAVAYNTEFHFACVYDPTGNSGSPRLSYYKNGALIGALNTSFRPQDIVFINNWLGRSNWSGDANTDASYNEFRIWDGPFSVAAIGDSVAAGPNILPQPPRVDAFVALQTATMYFGDTARLSYVLADPASLGLTSSINQGVGALTGSSGYVTVAPAVTTTYTLTTTNSAATRTAQATITVLPSAPTALNQSVSVPYNTATPITLASTDPNTPLNLLTYTIITPPQHGTLGTSSTASQTYTPTPGYSGTDGFTFLSNDGFSNSNVATVNITVLPPPVPPSDILPSAPAIFTDSVAGAFVARLQPMDLNPTDTHTLQLVSGTGSIHNAFFTISGNQLISAHNFSGDALGSIISIRVRVTDNTGSTFEKVITFTVSAPTPHVKINEIHYNPARNTQLTEFIELTNPTGAPVNVSGWHFFSGVEYTFPAGTIIAPGAYLVVASDPATLLKYYGVTAFGPWTGGLSSEGENIKLLDQFGTQIDSVDFSNTAPWPATPNGDGPTAELIHPSLDNDTGGHWRASTQAPVVVNYLPANSTAWRYRKGTSEASSPVTSWRAEAFTEDGTWLTGQAPIGLFKKDSDAAISNLPETGVTLLTQLPDMATYGAGTFTAAYKSVFFRKTFTVSGAIPKQLLLRVMHDDAAIVWINGVEVARFGFPPGSPANPAFNTNAFYERANDPWSEYTLPNADTLLHSGTNIIAIQGFAKLPTLRPGDDAAVYNVFDFCIDAELKNVPDTLGTPGAQNSVFSTLCPPAVRNIAHSPKQPAAVDAITVAAKISDEQGVGTVTLSYQICAPGNFIPATLPYSNATLLASLVANPNLILAANPAFELAANWTTIAMVDNGSVAGDIPGDGIFTARIPAQPHRTLVRYRINAADLTGLNVRVPSTEDPRRNFAAYVYNGVPSYTGGGTTFSTATLNTLPVYQWLTRASDFSSLLAYTGAEQFANTIDLNVLLSRRYENWEGALVVGDQVLDHTLIRLRGGNSRYNGTAKRHLRFKFPKGTPLEAADEQGNKYPRPWVQLLFNKQFGNKGYYDWGIPYEVGGALWRLMGVPVGESHWTHFRVVRNASESDPALGDFWGMYQALEFPDGKNFLAARGLPAGNFFKMSDWTQNGEMEERYQAPRAPDFAEDFDNVRYNIHQTTPQATIETNVNTPLWYRYNAVQEAIRHRDIFTEPTGRHRSKNLIWYFNPGPLNPDGSRVNPLGQCWFMPYDWDASFGPDWPNPGDFMFNALYNMNPVTDSPTWTGILIDRLPMQIERRNAIREFRDLVWYRDVLSGRGPFDDIIDDAAAKISQFWPADRARWPASGAIADNPAGVPFKVQDMKNFAFVGWIDPVGGDQAVPAGGRAVYLDSITDTIDVGQLPATPTITYTGSGNYPVDGVSLHTTAFSDPQGAVTFSAVQWRIGEITDPTAPAYVATDPRIYEMTPVWESGTVASQNDIAVPSAILRTGHTYRARVRHKDATGRFGHWSAPLQFTATISNYLQVLHDNLMVTEVMYKPAAPNVTEAAAGYLDGDFEYIELRNVSASLTLNLANVRFTKGVDFDFAGKAIATLAPGSSALVVKNIAAFTLRYGSGKPIAGPWDAADSLNNGGEEVKLSFGAGAEIKGFTYSNLAPWPTQAAFGGYSLVLRSPESHPDHTLDTSWRASYLSGGTPGGDDRTTFATWAAANTIADPLADDDGDGLANLLEYALGTDPHVLSANVLPTQTVQSLTVNSLTANYLTLTFRHTLGTEDLLYNAQWSSDLTATWTTDGVQISSVPNGDGTVTETWRAPNPVNPTRYFGRLKVIKP